nr:hypothetical protein [uncultured Desulfobacter sp.]
MMKKNFAGTTKNERDYLPWKIKSITPQNIFFKKVCISFIKFKNLILGCPALKRKATHG